MLITNVTTVGFKMPDEYEAEQNFRINNDMDKWERTEDSQYVYYIKTDHSTMTVNPNCGADMRGGEADEAD